MAETARNPDALQEEIARTREELARTIDTIADRVSPKNAARRGAGQLKGNAESVRRKLPQGHSGDFHAQLAHRESDSASAGQQAASSVQATGEVLRSNRTVLLVGVGVLVVAVFTWRRMRH